MNIRGIRLGTILGLPVRVDWTVIAIFGLISWSLSAVVFPELVDGYNVVEYWTAGLATAVIFFASLLAHEMSHSVVAESLGIGVRDITLWLFGGVSTIEGDARTPRDELKIALAGPAMSFAIAIGAWALAAMLAGLGAPALLTGCMVWLGSINVILAVFNLAPAAPLDGGRVLHAWLWHRRGDRASAGVSASRAGRVFGWLLVTVGLVEFATADAVGGIWLAFLGWFLIAAARSEEEQVRLTRDLDNVRVHDLMTPHPITVPADASVAALLGEYVLHHHCSAFPVVEANGTLIGLVTLGRVRTLPHFARASTRVRDISWPLSDVTTANPEDLLLDVLANARAGGDGRILVLDAGNLVGIVSPTDITRAVQLSELARAS